MEYVYKIQDHVSTIDYLNGHTLGYTRYKIIKETVKQVQVIKNGKTLTLNKEKLKDGHNDFYAEPKPNCPIYLNLEG